KVYEYFLETAIQMPKSAGIMVNTVETLEQRALKAILHGESTSGDPAAPIYCIGPLIVASEGSGKDKHECLNWLDKQPSRRVLFLSFGSLGKFSTEQLKEMALGLERSRVRFLWAVRNPPQEDDPLRKLEAAGVGEPSLEYLLPEGFIDRTKDQGLVAKDWVPQVPVLSHDSVGGFVTNCGWNSAMECLREGVPMLAWPSYAVQSINKLVSPNEFEN
ncbi:UDPGT domain-containing protein, partial [Cephalotus follicularis]